MTVVISERVRRNHDTVKSGAGGAAGANKVDKEVKVKVATKE